MMKINSFLIVLLEMLLMLIWMGVYTLVPFYEFEFISVDHWGFNKEFKLVNYALQIAVVGYLIMIPFINIRYQKIGRQFKSTVLYQKLKSKTYDGQFRQILLSYFLKFQFIPLMFLGMLAFGTYTYGYLIEMKSMWKVLGSGTVFFNEWFYYFFHYLTMTIILAVYAFGYIVESDQLGSRIKKVDDNPFTWVITLICYAPWYALMAYVIPMGALDSAFFKNAEITKVVRMFLIILILLKVWSVVTLGTKSSNLTNRGIVTSGPYQWVRHPHYLSKLIFWWIVLIPSAIGNYWLISGMIFWTTIYVLRGLMEENFLKSDPEYQAYMKAVKWRFIPGVF